jgi:hypothetical protein
MNTISDEEMTELVKNYIFHFTWENNFKIIIVTRTRFYRKIHHIQKSFQQLIDEDYHGYIDLAIQGQLITALKEINYYKFIGIILQLRETDLILNNIERLTHTERIRLFTIMKNIINTSTVDEIHEIIKMGDVRDFGMVSIDIK